MMRIELRQMTPDVLNFIAQQGSVCYDSDPKNPLGLVRHLYKSGHHSVFEHVYFTFHITGVSRALTHQLVRHRHSSFSQRSQRYCSESDPKYVMPPSVEQLAGDDFIANMELIWGYYGHFQEQTIPNEDARYVLPNACETEIVMSCNLSQLIHIANVRLCNRAQWEIRQMVRKMCDLVIEQEPALKEFLVPQCEVHAPYCFCTEGKSCGRHKTLKEVFELAAQYESLCK